MLKKVLCLLIIAATLITTGTAISADATTVDAAQTALNTKTLVMGDIDLDGDLSVMDATELQRGLAGIKELTEEQWLVANTTGSGNVYVGDATEIQRFLAGYKCNGCTGETIKVEIPDDDDNTIDLEAIEKAVEKRFMEYVNEERTTVGVHTLATNDELMASAKIRGDELPVDFSHTRPDGTSCFTAIENTHHFGCLGENIAYNAGYVNFSNPDTIEKNIDILAYKFYDQFKNSPGHYANMINEDFNCHGVGVTIVTDSVYGFKCYAAHMFGEAWTWN